MDIDTAMKSVVAVRANIPDDAFTAGGLGTRREGSGVVISEKGLVLTIGYLITEAEEVRVVAGHALAYDQETGFGLIQALGKLDLPALPLGKSGATRLGDAVTFVDGTGNSVHASIVAKQEFAGYWEYLLDEAIFIAPAHPSWGGAGMLSPEGQLLGIGSLRLQMIQNGEVADINMVVPIDLLPPILDDLVTRGSVDRAPRPWLGVFTAESDGDVVVMNVSPNSPAARAGIKRGDIISDIRDQEIGGLADFYRKVWGSGPAGAEVPMRIVRDGRDTWVRVKSADRSTFLKRPDLQ